MRTRTIFTRQPPREPPPIGGPNILGFETGPVSRFKSYAISFSGTTNLMNGKIKFLDNIVRHKSRMLRSIIFLCATQVMLLIVVGALGGSSNYHLNSAFESS